MPRKRMLHPTIWDDPDLAQLTAFERLLFVGLISLADDYGHVTGNPAVLRKTIFGFDDDVSVAQVQEMRGHILAACHNVVLYCHGGQEYVWLRTWDRHQDLRYRARAQYPCHQCGKFHTSEDYQGCSAKPAKTAVADQPPLPEPQDVIDTITQDLRSACVDVAQDLRPDYVTSRSVTSRSVKGSGEPIPGCSASLDTQPEKVLEEPNNGQEDIVPEPLIPDTVLGRFARDLHRELNDPQPAHKLYMCLLGIQRGAKLSVEEYLPVVYEARKQAKGRVWSPDTRANKGPPGAPNRAPDFLGILQDIIRERKVEYG